MITVHLGGFQETANYLTGLSGKEYSRQSVHQLWKRRNFNNFPDRKQYLINGYVKEYFDMKDIAQWYSKI